MKVPVTRTFKSMAKLKPAFKEDGVVTAGNSSKISDGASALVVMSREKAQALGSEAYGKSCGPGSGRRGTGGCSGCSHPVDSKGLKKAGLSLEDIDLFEINEAFSATTVAVMKALGIDKEKVNVRGGAVALGHPIGASGARVLTTLLYAMKERGVEKRNGFPLPRRG